MFTLYVSIASATPGWTAPGDIGVPSLPAGGHRGAGLGEDVITSAVALDEHDRLLLARLRCEPQVDAHGAPTRTWPCEASLSVDRWRGSSWERLGLHRLTLAGWPDLRLTTDDGGRSVAAIGDPGGIRVLQVHPVVDEVVSVPGLSKLLAVTGAPRLGFAHRDGDAWVWRWAADGFTHAEPMRQVDGWPWASTSRAGLVTVTAFRLQEPERRSWGWDGLARGTWPTRANLPTDPAVLMPTPEGPRWRTLARSTGGSAPLPVDGGQGGLSAVATPVFAGIHEGRETGLIRFPDRPEIPPFLAQVGRPGDVRVLDLQPGPVIHLDGSGDRARIAVFDRGDWRGLGVEGWTEHGLGSGLGVARPTWVASAPPTLKWFELEPEHGLRLAEASLHENGWRNAAPRTPPPPDGDCAGGRFTHWATPDAAPVGVVHLRKLCEGKQGWLGGSEVAGLPWDTERGGSVGPLARIVETNGQNYVQLEGIQADSSSVLAHSGDPPDVWSADDEVLMAWVDRSMTGQPRVVIVARDGEAWTRAELPVGAHAYGPSVDRSGGRSVVGWKEEDGVHVVANVGSGWLGFDGQSLVFAGASEVDVVALGDRACVAFVAPDVAGDRVGVLCHAWPAPIRHE
jgi:hypothetical protein